jgi:Fe-S-cluster-containing dehydrogenase component
MSINRRSFFKVLGLTGAALATGTRLGAIPKDKNEAEFYGILCDTTRCKGCHGCEYDCSDANNLPLPPSPKEITGPRKPDEAHRTVVNEFQTSKGTVYLKTQCMHCNEPACAAACLTGAMHKTHEGPVIWRGSKCMGCRYCMVSCPFDVPKFEYHSPNPIIQKCDMCWESRLQHGELPSCVENCPNDALKYAPRRELIKEARKRIHDNPDQYIDHIYGEHEAGGTGFLYLAGVTFEELGLRTNISNDSYPALTKGFLYSVPTIFVAVPALLAGIHQATKNNNLNTEEDDEK